VLAQGEMSDNAFIIALAVLAAELAVMLIVLLADK
jgi:hypothetical protein